MKVRILAQGMAWRAEAEVRSKAGDDYDGRGNDRDGRDGREGRDRNDRNDRDDRNGRDHDDRDSRSDRDDWLAFEALRRPRALGAQAITKVVPRTWAALVQLEKLVLPLPAPAGETLELELELDNRAPTLPCMLDTPQTPPVDSDDVLDATALAFSLAVPAAAGQLPAWVDKVRLRRVRNGRTETSNTTLEQVASTLLGAVPGSAEQLVFDSDGLRLRARRVVPWWDSAGQRLGWFRLLNEGTAQAPRWTQVLEHGDEWLTSLRRFQAAAVRASARVRDPYELPSPAAPSVGLLPAPLPAELVWREAGGAWQLSTELALFELELRGVADGAVRWAPQTLTLTTTASAITVLAQTGVPATPAPLGYRFQRATGENEWSAHLELSPVAQAANEALDKQRERGDQAARVWVFTETGALAVPLAPAAPPPTAQPAPPSVLAGALTLAEVPWAEGERSSEAEPLPPPYPDLGQVDRGRLFVLGAETARASFTFSPAGDELTLQALTLELDRVRARLEEWLAAYLPARLGAGPPALPRPDELAEFHDLPLEHRPGAAANLTRFTLHARLAPGQAAPRREASWLERRLELRLPAVEPRPIYWYRPAELRWIPSLPWGFDPRTRPDERISAARTYLPLRPVLAPAPVTLGPGAAWYLPALAHGSFTAVPAASTELPRPFAWVSPDLPGMSFAPSSEAPLLIQAGRLAGGPVAWTARAGLPLLDELHALRVLDTGPAPAPAPIQTDAEWWPRLQALAALAQARRDRFFTRETALHPQDILRTTEEVELEHVYAAQRFAAQAAVDVRAGAASIALRTAEGALIPAMTPTRQLEGLSCRFDLVEQPAHGSPVLAPSAAADAAIELRAGSLPPQVLPTFTFDQSGRLSRPPSSLLRPVEIPPSGEPSAEPGAPAGALRPHLLWTAPPLELSCPGASLTLHLVGLPLAPEADRLVYRRGSMGDRDEHLRDCRWAALGEPRLFGLSLQLLALERVAFPAGAAWPPSPAGTVDGAPHPDEVVVTGVLHARPGAVRLADAETQTVTLTLQRGATGWALAAVQGHVLWPLYEASPDAADAVRADLTDPLPWLESEVSLSPPGQPLTLHLGTAARPATLVCRLLERTLAVPVALEGGGLPTTGAGDELRWQALAEPSTSRGELRLSGGKLALDRRELPQLSSTLDFELWLGPSTTPPLAELSLRLHLAPRAEPALTLRRARLLASTSQALLTVQDPAAAELAVRNGRLSVALNVGPGFRSGTPPFELLPAWPVDDTAALHAYLTAGFVAPGAARVTSIATASSELVLETALRPPALPGAARAPLSADGGRLATVVTSTLVEGSEPRYRLALTGLLSATSEVTWPSGASRWRHDVTFALHQAVIPGERLRADASSFFAPRPLTAAEDPSGLGGMSEVACLASHRLYDETTGQEVARFTAPQRLRLAAPAAFAQELALRGGRKVEVVAVRSRPSSNHWFELRDATTFEQGFAGPLGAALVDTWRDQPTMILEATEAFWLRLLPSGTAARAPLVLWRKEAEGLACTPTQERDFTAAPADWVRMPVPFITDSRGVARAARTANPTGELARLCANRPRRQPPAPPPRTPTPLPHHTLLHRAELDRAALHAAPPRLDEVAAIDPVLLQPDAHARLGPYLKLWPGYQPGWLTFLSWTPGTSAPDYAVPFSGTAEALAGLPPPGAAPRLCLAATEVVPEIVNGAPLGPRLLPSPALALGTSLATQLGDEVPLLLELWHPGAAGLALGARAVFRCALPAGITWRALLLGDPGDDLLRAAMVRWLETARARIPAERTALLRARALAPSPSLAESETYLLLDSERPRTPQRARRDRLAPRQPLAPDPRLELRTEPVPPDPLALGPELIGSRVYYVTDEDARPPDAPAVAGSAVALAYKLAGTAPGPRHRTRLPRTHAGAERRWLETTRDLLFVDRTRRDPESQREPGWYLPAVRPAPAMPAAHAGAAPFFPTHVTTAFTAGRPGELMRLRLSVLTESASGLLRRGASVAHELRFPRPAPLPRALRPMHPLAPDRTALVEPLPPRPPFSFAKLTWQDPIYNRGLLAVTQQTEGDGLTLLLDRSIYAGTDVIYPELRYAPPPGVTTWRVTATLRLSRVVSSRLTTVAQLDWTVDDTALLLRDSRDAGDSGAPRPIPAARQGAERRWVLELGLDQPEPLDFDGNLDFEAQNRDELEVEATVHYTQAGVPRSRTIRLRGLLRTDLYVWPQPQAAYAILRTRAPAPQELVAFGWLPRPTIVRRHDRFIHESWRGTFRYLDTWLDPGAEDPPPVDHEVATITAFGEQLAPHPTAPEP